MIETDKIPLRGDVYEVAGQLDKPFFIAIYLYSLQIWRIEWERF